MIEANEQNKVQQVLGSIKYEHFDLDENLIESTHTILIVVAIDALANVKSYITSSSFTWKVPTAELELAGELIDFDSPKSTWAPFPLEAAKHLISEYGIPLENFPYPATKEDIPVSRNSKELYAQMFYEKQDALTKQSYMDNYFVAIFVSRVGASEKVIQEAMKGFWRWLYYEMFCVAIVIGDSALSQYDSLDYDLTREGAQPFTQEEFNDSFYLIRPYLYTYATNSVDEAKGLRRGLVTDRQDYEFVTYARYNKLCKYGITDKILY